MTKNLCIKHKAFNDMFGKGFDSDAQRRFLFYMYTKGDPHYQWVPEIWDKYGEPPVEKVDGPWSPPYGCWMCGAEQDFDKKLKKQGDTEMNWLKKFVDDEEIKKIAKKVDANFLDRIKQVHELSGVIGSTMKWATVEEALEDFARRNNLDTMQKRALNRRLQLQKVGISLEDLEKEGIDSEKAIEYMSKSKNKHKELSEEKGKKIINEKREHNKKLAPDISKELSGDEVGSSESVGEQMAKVDNKKIKIKSFCRKIKK